MNREFIQLKEFTDIWSKLGLTDEDLRRLEQEISKNPEAGDIMEHTGGVRKIRFALPNRSKSSSVRVIYVDFVVQEHIYLITVFAKKQQSNLTDAEKNVIRKLMRQLKQIEGGKFMEDINNYDINLNFMDEEDDNDFPDFEFNLFDSMVRGLTQAIEYAKTHNKAVNEDIKLTIKETDN